MKFLLLYCYIFAAGILFNTGSSESLSEDDGFRRLLRRASAEADRPLIREQRRNKDEDDEDVFNDSFDAPVKKESDVTRKRREEDDFYHTLLIRAEPKHKEKRSFDTQDADHKLQSYVVREDWTGNSKISDADRQELESLFNKLNADDGFDKKEKIRSTEDDVQMRTSDDEDKGPVNEAASSYASWLMGQPVKKLSAALTHKADVDHTLTKIFFEDKRARIPSVCENDPACKCKHACKPYTVAHYFPCHCSTHYPERSKSHKSYPLEMHLHHAHKRNKDEDSRPGNVRYPDPPHWMAHKKNFAPRMNISKVASSTNGTTGNIAKIINNATVAGNNTTGNCTTPECQCKRSCNPSQAVTVTPCVCQKDATNTTTSQEKSDAKNLILQGSKLCTDDSPKCLCTRACFPKSVASYTPCNCEGELNGAENKTVTVTNTTAVPADYVKPAFPAKKIVQANFKYTEKSGGVQLNMKLPQACNDNEKDCSCKKMCYPNPVAETMPCKCDVLIKVSQPPGNKTNQPISISDAQSNIKVNNSESSLEKLNLALENPSAKLKQTFKSKSVSSRIPNVSTAFTQIPPLHHDFIDLIEGEKQVLAKGKPAPVKSENQPKPVQPAATNNIQSSPLISAPVDTLPPPSALVGSSPTPLTPLAPAADSAVSNAPDQINVNTQTSSNEQTPLTNAVPSVPLISSAMGSTGGLIVNAHQPEQYANTPATLANTFVQTQPIVNTLNIQPIDNTLNTQSLETIPATQRQNVDASNTTKADQRAVVDPLARTWCKQACHPLDVAEDNPCKCIAAQQKPSTAQANLNGNQTTAQTVAGNTQASSQNQQIIAQASAIPAVQPNVLAPGAVAPQLQVSPMFPPKAPEAFPPRAPGAAKIPLMANYQSVGANPEMTKVPSVQNAAVSQPLKIANVVGPSAAIVQSTAAFSKQAVPAVPAAQSQAYQAQYNYRVPQANAAGAASQYPANIQTLPAATHVTANVRHDVHQSKTEPPVDNQCTRTCRPNKVLRHKPCTCGVIKVSNDTVKQTKNNQVLAPVIPLQQQQPVQQPAQPSIQQVQAVPQVPQVANVGLFGTNAPIYITHPSYQGCFKDRMPVRDLPKRYTRFDTTPEACISECKYQNYKFAGVQYGYLCFCGNAFGRYGRVADNDCNSICNGDMKRNCGAFWHNSVYSVDGKEYDPTDFDFAKVDADERLRDTLPSPAVQQPPPVVNPNKQFIDTQGANLATHLMKAAQAALQAAKKLLPSVSKKHKVHHRGHKRHKEKRSDDEEDAEIMEEKMAAMASLSAAKQIMQKTNFGLEKREAEREKRSIDEDSDPFDPENGKELLKAYLANIDIYKRQVRSVDDDEEDDDLSEKQTFDYRRMTIGEEDDGQFVEKYDDDNDTKDKKTKRSISSKNRRSTGENVKLDDKTVSEKNKTSSVNSSIDTNNNNTQGNITLEKSETFDNTSNANSTNNVTANATESNNKTESNAQRKDIITDASGDVEEKRSEIDNEQDVKPSGENLNGQRKKRRSLEGKISRKTSIKVKAIKRSTSVSGGKKRQRRSLSDFNEEVTTLAKSKSAKNVKLSEENVMSSRKRKRRSIDNGSAYLKQKKRRDLNDKLSDVVFKTNVRGADLKKLEENLVKLDQITKRSDQSSDDDGDDDNMNHDDSDDDDDNDKDVVEESESGSGEFDWEDGNGETSGSGENDDDVHDLDRRDVESNNARRIIRRSSDDGASIVINNATSNNEDEKAHLRSDVEKGVDSLLNLVVELYKQQKTIKAFESSVRSLRHDILRQLNVPREQKTTATAKVRDEIEKTARERLHVLTSSIERKITEFAKNHPEASKQANLASTLLPKLPLSDDKYLDSKKEISKRSAEFDNIEDTFGDQVEIPDILREHFKRNSEDDVEFEDPRPKRSIIHGEQNLSRMHRDVQESQYEVSQEDAVDELEKLLD